MRLRLLRIFLKLIAFILSSVSLSAYASSAEQSFDAEVDKLRSFQSTLEAKFVAFETANGENIEQIKSEIASTLTQWDNDLLASSVLVASLISTQNVVNNIDLQRAYYESVFFASSLARKVEKNDMANTIVDRALAVISLDADPKALYAPVYLEKGKLSFRANISNEDKLGYFANAFLLSTLGYMQAQDNAEKELFSGWLAQSSYLLMAVYDCFLNNNPYYSNLFKDSLNRVHNSLIQTITSEEVLTRYNQWQASLMSKIDANQWENIFQDIYDEFLKKDSSLAVNFSRFFVSAACRDYLENVIRRKILIQDFDGVLDLLNSLETSSLKDHDDYNFVKAKISYLMYLLTIGDINGTITAWNQLKDMSNFSSLEKKYPVEVGNAYVLIVELYLELAPQFFGEEQLRYINLAEEMCHKIVSLYKKSENLFHGIGSMYSSIARAYLLRAGSEADPLQRNRHIGKVLQNAFIVLGIWDYKELSRVFRVATDLLNTVKSALRLDPRIKERFYTKLISEEDLDKIIDNLDANPETAEQIKALADSLATLATKGAWWCAELSVDIIPAPSQVLVPSQEM